jgi:hypothetical protein
VASIAITALASPAAWPAESDELAELRQMVEAMRADYEKRILDLEQRLERAERAAATGTAVTTATKVAAAPDIGSGSQPGTVTSGNAFNPQTSVILNGNYYHDDVNGEGTEIAGEAFQPSHTGHAHTHSDHDHGGASNGFNFSELELAFSASVDPYFDAEAYLAIDDDGNVELEEAWFQTRGLPYGLKLKGGKFLSDFGYANKQHPHQWDFANQNLPYLNLLGIHGIQDTGLQLTWLPNLPIYTLVGAELLQGDQERLGAFVDDSEERDQLGLSSREDGPRLWTAFARISPELGYDHTLQIGASFAHNRQHQEIHQHEELPGEEHAEVGLEGDADIWGLDLVYKYDDPAPNGQHDFKLQTEYLRSIKDLEVRGGPAPAPGSSRKLTTDGLYIQALYGMAPRWQAALRYDVLGLTNKVSGGGESDDFDSSERWTLGISWLPTEFSLIRLQYDYSDILVEPGERERFNSVWLQFVMSMGAHGAHRF